MLSRDPISATRQPAGGSNPGFAGRRIVRWAWAVSVLVATSGCTLVTPARFDRVPPRDTGAAFSTGTPEMPLTGRYIATIFTPWTGPLRGRLLAEPTDDGFRANTPPDVAWSLMGGLRGSLGPIFVPFIFPRGMIITWTSTAPTPDLPGVGSIGFGTRPSMRLATRILSPGAPVELVMKDGRVVGMMTLQRSSGGDRSLTNHAALVSALESIVERSLYDPDLARSSAMRSFLDDLRDGTAKVHDDFEFLLVQALAIREASTLAAPMLYPKPIKDLDPELAHLDNPVRPYLIGKDEHAEITIVRFDAILDEHTVDEAFEKAMQDDPWAIVLDLRKAAGLDIGALRLLSWISTEPVEAGSFLGRSERDAATRDGASNPVVTLETPRDYEHLRDLLAHGESAAVRVLPNAAAFRGPIAVLLGKRASGPVEAVASAVREVALAPTFGGATSGKPLASSEFELGQGWVARMPVAEFRPTSGETLMETGVQPLFPTRDGGMDKALEWLATRLAQHEWDLPAWDESPSP